MNENLVNSSSYRHIKTRDMEVSWFDIMNIAATFLNHSYLGELYRFIYQTCMARSDVKEMPGKLFKILVGWVRENSDPVSSVEDPNDEFSDMRDKNDLRYLREHHAFDDLKAPVSREKIKELSSKFKLTEVRLYVNAVLNGNTLNRHPSQRQFQRCLEMHLLSQVNKLDRQAYKQFRLQVKRRLYLFNLASRDTIEISGGCLLTYLLYPLGCFTHFGSRG